MRLTQWVYQCSMPHGYFSRLLEVPRLPSRVRPMMRPMREPAVRSSNALVRMPRPGPRTHSRLVLVREEMLLVGGNPTSRHPSSGSMNATFHRLKDNHEYEDALSGR